MSLLISLLILISGLYSCSSKHTDKKNSTEATVLQSEHHSDEHRQDSPAYLTEEQSMKLQLDFDKDSSGTLLLPGKSLQSDTEQYHRTFKDQFKRLGPWPALSDAQCLLKLQDSSYYMQHKIDSTAYHIHIPLPIDQRFNWAIETILLIEHADSLSSLGLHLGIEELNKNGHYFLVNTSNKQLSILSKNNEKEMYHLKERYSDAINSGLNKLRIESKQNYWYYFINDYLVYCHKAAPFAGNQFGFSLVGKVEVSSEYYQIQW